MNEVLFILAIIITLLTILGLSKFFNKRGLTFAIVLLDIISYITTFKIIEVLKLNINLGIVSFVAALSVVYIYLIKYGKKELSDINQMCLYANVATMLFIVIMNYFIPALTETVSINVEDTFKYNYKLLILFPLIMFLSQFIIIKLYTFVSKIQTNIPICIILTYIITSLVYVLLFYCVGYINVLSLTASLYIGLSTYIVGLMVTIINAIFITIFVKSKKVLK